MATRHLQQPHVPQQPTAQLGRDHGLGAGMVTQCDELSLVFHRLIPVNAYCPSSCFFI